MSRRDTGAVVTAAPTDLLDLAARLAWDPAELPWVLAQHLDSEVVWRAAPEDDRVEGATMCLADPDGGTLRLRRPGPAYTPEEVGRARALAELASRIRITTVPREWAVMLPDGREVTLRRTGGADLAAVRALHRRCSVRSRRARYLTVDPPHSQHGEWLERVVAPRVGYTLAAQSAEEEIVGVATLLWDGPEAEVGILVEDAWQGRRVGTALLRRLLTVGREAGVTVLHTHTGPENLAVPRLAQRVGLTVTARRTDGVVTYSARL